MGQFFIMLIHPGKPPRHLRRSGFEAYNLQIWVAFENAAANVNHKTNHRFNGAADHMGKEEIVRKAFMTHRPGLGVMENNRHLQLLELVKDRIEMRVPPLFSWNWGRLYVQRLAA